jgi:hypothetical protein
MGTLEKKKNQRELYETKAMFKRNEENAPVLIGKVDPKMKDALQQELKKI